MSVEIVPNKWCSLHVTVVSNIPPGNVLKVEKRFKIVRSTNYHLFGTMDNLCTLFNGTRLCVRMALFQYEPPRLFLRTIKRELGGAKRSFFQAWHRSSIVPTLYRVPAVHRRIRDFMKKKKRHIDKR